MFCLKCGKELKDNQKFCDGCGGKNINYKPDAGKKAVKKATEETAKKAMLTKIIAGITSVAVLGGGFAGYKYLKEKPDKSTEAVEEVGEVEETKEANTDVELQKASFSFTSDQIQKIEGAARLFDELQCEVIRDDYSLDLQPENIPSDVINNLVAGVVCADDNLGTLIEQDEFQNQTKTLSIEECTDLLEKSFGCTKEEARRLEGMFTKYSDTEYVFTHKPGEYMTESYTGDSYTAERFVQTAKDEYHFYVTVESKYRSGQPEIPEGVMDITVRESKDSRFAGFVFEHIEFDAFDGIYEDEDTDLDYGKMIGDMITAKAEICGNSSSPIGSYDVNTLSEQEFMEYAQLFLSDADCTSGIRIEESSEGTEQYLYTIADYRDMSENTLGRNHDLGSWEGEQQDATYTVNSSLKKYTMMDSIFYQDLDGIIYVEGKLNQMDPFTWETEGFDKYQFAASGYVNEKSKAGFVIDKIEVKGDTENAWKNAYIDWVNKWGSDTTFELLDINGDEIPEIAAIGADMSKGTTVATYGANGIQEVEMYRCEAKYYAGKNVLDNCGGSMDTYQDRIFKIENGNWIQIVDGKYGFIDEAPVQYDENDEPIYQYEWGGKQVTKEQYEKEVKKIIDVENANEVAWDGVTAEKIKYAIYDY